MKNSMNFQGLLKDFTMVFKDYLSMKILINMLKVYFRNARLRYLRNWYLKNSIKLL